MYLLLPMVCALAQNMEKEEYYKKKYLNISFTNATLKQDGLLNVRGNYGVSLSRGKTYYVTESPFFNMLRVGIDATWFDFSYRNYNDASSLFDIYDYFNNFYDDYYDYDDDDEGSHKINEMAVGVQVGPSVTLNPVSKLNIHAYVRYAPSFAAFYYDGLFRGGYGSYFTTGFSVTYSCIGIGIEGKFGRTKVGSVIDEDWDKKMKTTTNGFRVYLAFRY